MPGFWETLSQTADRYNQIRADLEREQAEITNMMGNQMNVAFSNTMAGANLISGLLGQKLNTLLGLYGTEVTQSEGEKSRKNAYDVAKLEADTRKAVAGIEAGNRLNLAELQAKYEKELEGYRNMLKRSNLVFEDTMQRNKELETNQAYAGFFNNNEYSMYFKNNKIPAKKVQISIDGTHWVDMQTGDTPGVTATYPNSSTSKYPKQQIQYTPEVENRISKLINKYPKVNYEIRVNDPNDYAELDEYYRNGLINERPVFVPSLTNLLYKVNIRSKNGF